MIGYHTPKEFPEVSLQYISDEDGVMIERVNINGQPVSSGFEDALIETYGDEWDAEILVSLKEQDDDCRIAAMGFDTNIMGRAS